MKLPRFWRTKWFWVVLGLGVIVRVALWTVPGHGWDVEQWWKLTHENNFGNSYHVGFYYLFKAIELISPDQLTFNYILKLPIYLADLLSGLIILDLVRKGFGDTKGLWAFVFYFLNPALIWLSTCWSQVDTIIILLSLASIWCLFNKKAFLLGILSGLLLTTKPQVIFILVPLLLAALVYLKKDIWKSLLAAFISLSIVIFPLFGLNYLSFINKFFFAYGLDNQITVSANNFWLALDSSNLARPDSDLIFGLVSYKNAGYIIFGILFLFFAKKWWKNRKDEQAIFPFLFMTIFTFFMFFTRAHERYTIYALPFLILWMFSFSQSKKSNNIFFLFSSFTFLIFATYVVSQNGDHVQADTLKLLMQILAGFMLAAYLFSIYNFYGKNRFNKKVLPA